MRVAAIDCGTNSVRLLIADRADDGSLVDVRRELRLTRLGQGVDFNGEFHPDALQRTLDVVEEYAGIIAEEEADVVRFVATSAARDARNRDSFFDGVRSRLGVPAEIIPGKEEARLSYEGARSGIPTVTDPVLVVDTGGGSTELVVGEGDEITFAVSLDMGSVRLRERFLHDDPPTPEQAEAARAFIDGMLDASQCPFHRIGSFIGVAGTVTTLSAAFQRLPVYDRTQVHGSRLSALELETLAETLVTMPVAEIMTTFPAIPAKRAEVIPGGALIIERVSRRIGVDMIVSEADVLDGIALELFQRG